MAAVNSGASSQPGGGPSKKFSTDGAVSATSAHTRRPAAAQRSHFEMPGNAASSVSPASHTSAPTVTTAAGTSKRTRAMATARSKKLPEKLANRMERNSNEATQAAPKGSVSSRSQPNV